MDQFCQTLHLLGYPLQIYRCFRLLLFTLLCLFIFIFLLFCHYRATVATAFKCWAWDDLDSVRFTSVRVQALFNSAVAAYAKSGSELVLIDDSLLAFSRCAAHLTCDGHWALPLLRLHDRVVADVRARAHRWQHRVAPSVVPTSIVLRHLPDASVKRDAPRRLTVWKSLVARVHLWFQSSVQISTLFMRLKLTVDIPNVSLTHCVSFCHSRISSKLVMDTFDLNWQIGWLTLTKLAGWGLQSVQLFH